MKRIFEYICIPLMLINNNVYTFISGILLSLSTGIITTLCLEKAELMMSWHLYTSSVIYTAAGGLFIYVASNITSYQNYIASKQIIDRMVQRSIISDFEAHRYRFWVIIFTVLTLSLVIGTALLFANYML